MDLFVYVYSWNDLAICSHLNLSPDPVNERVHASSSGSGVKLGTIPAPYETVKSGFVGILDGDCI